MGTLNDLEIKNMCHNGELITEEFYENNVKQACYELRASNLYYDVYKSDCSIDINKNNYKYILIKPKQCVVIITKEKLDLPLDIIGRILTKGVLFSIGISAVNTYADPGFSGRLGIVLMNLSNNYIKIQENDSIAKIEFSRLNKSVSCGYSGQHGYETKIWPMPKEFYLTDDEIKKDDRIKDVFTEYEDMCGKELAIMLRKIFKYERRLFISTCIMMLICMFMLTISIKFESLSMIKEFWSSVVIGILGSIIATRVYDRFTRRK